MATIQPELTSLSAGVAATDSAKAYNRGPAPNPPNWLELKRIVDLKEASRLSGLSVDSIKRHYRQKIIELSPLVLGCVLAMR